MRKSVILPGVAVAGGLVGLLVRRVYLAHGFEAGTGLPISGAPSLWAMVRVSAAVAAALLRTGIDYQTVNKVFFRTKSRRRMQLEAAILNDCTFYDRDRVAVLSVPLSLMARIGASETDAEDLSALGPQIEGVDCAITMRELRPDVWKMSLRTGPRINATEACRLLGGGGHAAAAGCTVEAPWAEARERILAAVAQVAPDYQR